MIQLRRSIVFLCGALLLPVLSCLRAGETVEETCPVPAADSALWGKERDGLRLAVLPLPDHVPGAAKEDRFLTVVLENLGDARSLNLLTPVCLFSLDFLSPNKEGKAAVRYTHRLANNMMPFRIYVSCDWRRLSQNTAIVFRLNLRKIIASLPEDRKGWEQCRLMFETGKANESVCSQAFPVREFLAVPSSRREHDINPYCPLEFYTLRPGLTPLRIKELPVSPDPEDSCSTINFTFGEQF